MSNTPSEELLYSECDQKCLDCNFECDDPSFAISTILDEKHYGQANTDLGKLNGALLPCLTMYNEKALKLKKNIAKFGIQVQITRIPNGKNYLRWVFFSGYQTTDLLNIFRKLDVIK